MTEKDYSIKYFKVLFVLPETHKSYNITCNFLSQYLTCTTCEQNALSTQPPYGQQKKKNATEINNQLAYMVGARIAFMA